MTAEFTDYMDIKGKMMRPIIAGIREKI